MMLKKSFSTVPLRTFTVLVKPTGPRCNLRCGYCFYLEKHGLYPEVRDFRMQDDVLETFIRQYIAAVDLPEVGFIWQGGEPTLLGLEFFKNVLNLQREYADGRRITNSLQTNGTLIDDKWCEFLAKNRFLVGLSLDGPEELHDAYRLDAAGEPRFICMQLSPPPETGHAACKPAGEVRANSPKRQI